VFSITPVQKRMPDFNISIFRFLYPLILLQIELQKSGLFAPGNHFIKSLSFNMLNRDFAVAPKATANCVVFCELHPGNPGTERLSGQVSLEH